MAGKRVVAVAGTHGKTTTTSMLTMALRAAGADPTYAIGGVLAATGRNADAGSGDLFVAEADESDGAFLVYSPRAALVTNVDADHLDVWGSEEALPRGVHRVRRHDRAGTACWSSCADDDGRRRAGRRRAGARPDVVTVGGATAPTSGLTGLAEVTGRHASSFDGVAGGEGWARVTLQVPGRHYVLDAAAPW